MSGDGTDGSRDGASRRAEHATAPVRALVKRTDGRAGDVPPQAAVLVLHGGRADGLGPPPPWNLPRARMLPFERAVQRATAGHGVALGRVRYVHRGWNGDRDDPVRDAEQALTELLESTGPVPVVLVGHSMGGRAALRAAGHPCVRGVVGLAPWCPLGEPVTQLSGSSVVLLHGDRDGMTDPRGSADLVRRARAGGAEAGLVPMPGGDHAMLRDAALWHSLTVRTVTGLLGLTPMPAPVADALAPRGMHTPEG